MILARIAQKENYAQSCSISTFGAMVARMSAKNTKSIKQTNRKRKDGEAGMNNKTAERRTRQNERLLSVMKENILFAREHKRKGDIDSYFRVMSFVQGMMYACGIMRPQFRWTKKINELYDVLNEHTVI